MVLKDLIGRGYFPKELPPSFDTSDLANNSTSILSDWNTIFELNTNINSPTFPVAKLLEESKAQYKERKKKHRDDFMSQYGSSRAAIYSISKGKLSRRFLQIPNPKHFSILSEKITSYWANYEAVFILSDYSKSYPVDQSQQTVGMLLILRIHYSKHPLIN